MINLLNNINTALRSIWANKVRSFLTVLGVVIGVASVSILVSLGRGLEHEVANLIRGFGTNVVTVVGGSIDTQAGIGSAPTNPANFISGDILTLADYQSIIDLPEIYAASPMTLVAGSLKYGESNAAPTVFGAYPSIIDAFEILKLDRGNVFANNDENSIILGSKIVTTLFGDQATFAVGKTVLLGSKELTVVGVLAEPKSASLFGSEFDNLAVIPFDTATTINKNQVKIMRIISRANSEANMDDVKSRIKSALAQNHHEGEDYSVLTQDDLLGLFKEFLNLSTALVTAIAAISLIVGGIGIMNIMLVTVTERTQEIGLRKAVGATKISILTQFITEAIVVTLLGGLIGLGIAIATGLIIARQTPLAPVFGWDVFALAFGVSGITGLVFGLWPAIRAANMDPIEALRHE